MSAAARAEFMIFAAVASPISAAVTNSAGDATAIASNELNPPSRNFSAIAGPTPANSSKSTLFSPLSVIDTYVYTSRHLNLCDLELEHKHQYDDDRAERTLFHFECLH